MSSLSVVEWIICILKNDWYEFYLNEQSKLTNLIPLNLFHGMLPTSIQLVPVANYQCIKLSMRAIIFSNFFNARSSKDKLLQLLQKVRQCIVPLPWELEEGFHVIPLLCSNSSANPRPKLSFKVLSSFICKKFLVLFIEFGKMLAFENFSFPFNQDYQRF